MCLLEASPTVEGGESLTFPLLHLSHIYRSDDTKHGAGRKVQKGSAQGSALIASADIHGARGQSSEQTLWPRLSEGDPSGEPTLRCGFTCQIRVVGSCKRGA